MKARFFSFGWMTASLILALFLPSSPTQTDSSNNIQVAEVARINEPSVSEPEVQQKIPPKMTAGIITQQAQKYVVLQTEEYATPYDKKGLKFTIYSETADTFEKRGQTLVQAAYDLLNEKDLYEVIVRLSALPSTKPKYIHAGLAYYHPHKKDTWGDEKEYIWDVTASPNKVVDGQLEENGKRYPLDYIATKSYLKK